MNSLITSGLLVVLIQAPAIALGQTAAERGLAIAVEADRRNRGFADSTAELRMIPRSRGGDERSRELRSRTLERPDQVTRASSSSTVLPTSEERRC